MLGPAAPDQGRARRALWPGASLFCAVSELGSRCAVGKGRGQGVGGWFMQDVGTGDRWCVFLSFLHPFIHSFLRSFIHSLAHSFIHSFVHFLFHLPSHPSVRSTRSLHTSSGNLNHYTLIMCRSSAHLLSFLLFGTQRQMLTSSS